MKRVTQLVDTWTGSCLWFLDDKYVGHDDQYDVIDVAEDGKVVTIELERLVVPESWFGDKGVGLLKDEDKLHPARAQWSVPG